MAKSESYETKQFFFEFESRKEAAWIEQSSPNLNPSETKRSWLNLDLEERLLGLNGRG